MTKQNGAEALLGLTLLDKWRIKRRIANDAGVTGQSRSSCYTAENLKQPGQLAFVKAFDFRHEEQHTDTEVLERMLREFNHEKNVHLLCKNDGLSRVTQIYDFGRIVVGEQPVHFLVCEHGNGTLREIHPPGMQSEKVSDRLLGLRKVASALSQLHGARVAHQDIKPSNAVIFDNSVLKLSDLGSSSSTRLPSPPHDDEAMSGQPGYAPYELLYNNVARDWYDRRVGTDFFLLGNLIFTTFVGASITILTLHGLPHSLRPPNSQINFCDVLPLIEELHAELVPQVLQVATPAEIYDDILKMVLEMCNPDPAKRGHEKNIRGEGARYGLERYISALDRLHTRMRISERKACDASRNDTGRAA